MAKKSPAASPRPDIQTLPVLQPDTAGVDVGADLLHVAVPPDRDPESFRIFGTFTQDLEALAAWLHTCGIRSVALESTGVYWIPLYQVLEAHGFQVCLVNARHLKNVRGRKTDFHDCQWLQQLHAVGLLQPSFRPEEAVCAVRTLLRYRETLVADAARQILHVQKALTQLNLQPHRVLSDLTGVRGTRILRALLAGERDPEKLAALCDPQVKAPRETVVAALRGDWREEHLFVLRQAWELYEGYQARVAACDTEIEQSLARFDSQADPADAPPPPPNAPRGKGRKNQFQLPTLDLRQELFRLYGTDLTQVPGLGPATVAGLFGEVGTDLTAFPSAGRFCSWLGLCPDPKKSGGKVLRHRTRSVNHRAAKLLRVAAQSLHHSHSALGQLYRRLAGKLQGPGAITALAHKLARIFYHLVTTKEAYDETVFARMEQHSQERKLKRLHKQAKELGFTLQATACVS
jgi:transposase